MNEKYERLGTPLEDYELTRQDHQRQRSLQEIREYARREAAKMPPLPDDVLEKVATLLSSRHQTRRSCTGAFGSSAATSSKPAVTAP